MSQSHGVLIHDLSLDQYQFTTLKRQWKNVFVVKTAIYTHCKEVSSLDCQVANFI